MKKIVSAIIIAGSLVVGCSSQTREEVKTPIVEAEPVTEKPATEKPEAMTKQMFLSKIWDFEKNPDEWIFKGDIPVIVDFYADWCRPCRITSPILEELAAEYAGKIKIYKIDTDKERELSAAFGIQSIPSFLYIPKNDKPVMSSGIAQTPEQTKQMFRQQIDEILLSKNQ